MSNMPVGSFDHGKVTWKTRGVVYSDEGHNKVLVKNNCDLVLGALSKILDTESLEANAYGKSLENSGKLLTVYQFKEQRWTIIEAPHFQYALGISVLKSYVAENLSKALSSKAIFYNRQPYEERFDVYERGEISEKFSFFPRGELEYQRRTNTIIQNKLLYFPEEESYAYFLPSLNEADVRKIKSSPEYISPYNMGECLLTKHEIYIPSIRWFSSFRPEENITITIENLISDDFEEFSILKMNSELI